MGGQKNEEQTLHFLEKIDAEAVPVIENAYVSIKEKFPEVYEQLWFNIDIPEALQLYDKGEYDGVVRFSDVSGKNLLTLETRFKEQPERYYQQYLHAVCANLSELSSFHEYPDPIEINGYSARRIDFFQESVGYFPVPSLLIVVLAARLTLSHTSIYSDHLIIYLYSLLYYILVKKSI